jgi:gamma-carbonic anhydrase
MATRTVTHSVPRADGPPANLAELEAALRVLQDLHPGAFIGRYQAHIPTVHPTAFVAPQATLIGAVTMDAEASVWPGCVLRGDVNHIHIGARSNLQDGTVVHLGDRDPTRIGADVVVGHRAVLHGCTIEDACMVGIQATVLDGATIGRGSIIGAGALVPAGMVVPPHSLVLGLPGRIVKTLDDSVEAFHRGLAAKYVRLSWNHRHG